MKTTMTLFAMTFLCACASSQPKHTSELYYHFPTDNLPPTDFEMTVADHSASGHTVVTSIEDDKVKYEKSLKHIQETFENEEQLLGLCVESSKERKSGMQACVDLKKHLCEVDELIDSRGDFHKKPYCWK